MMNQRTNNQLDIICIKLQKYFRNKDICAEHSSRWYVFGYYDLMKIDHISQDKEGYPLKDILNNSHQTSSEVDGTTKCHVIYAYKDWSESLQSFWSDTSWPLTMVSLIHLSHNVEIDGNHVDVYTNAKKIEQEIELLRDKNHCIFTSYLSIDCNDVILIWQTDSFKLIMDTLSSLCDRCEEYILNVFSIFACQNMLLEESKNSILLEKWHNGKDSPIKNVRIHLRAESFHMLRSQAIKLRDHEVDRFSDKATKVSLTIVPGQDDLLISYTDITPEDFIELFYYGHVVQEESPLPSFSHKGFLYKDGMISRTVLDFPLDENIDEDNQYNQHPEPSKYGLSMIEKLTKISNTRIKAAPWYSSLCELLNELSNMEINPTSYDIYIDTIKIQKFFIDLLVDILKKDDADYILASNSKLMSNILRYIEGWSQLSFHAMHAEWQLTQTLDINRLYLFPAKLNRIYTAFMEITSQILFACPNNIIPHSENNPRTRYKFFLTPKVCLDTTFTSVFKPLHNERHIVLGEIPADLLFQPDILLPIIVHETAHYSGTIPRSREKRYNVLVKSALAYFIKAILQEEYLWRKESSASQIILTQIVDEFFNEFIDVIKLNNQSFYGELIVGPIVKAIYEKYMNETSIVRRIILSLYRKLHPESRNESGYFQNIKAQNNEQNINIVRDLFYDGSNSSIQLYLDHLLLIYREAFSDICMITLLGISLPNYLKIIYYANRYDDSSDVVMHDHLNDLDRYARYLSVIHSMQNEQENDNLWCWSNFALACQKDEHISKKDLEIIQKMRTELEAIEKKSKPQAGYYFDPFAEALLLEYLYHVKLELMKIKHLPPVGLIKNIYTLLTQKNEQWSEDTFETLFKEFMLLLHSNI